jgi:hypothetical protein
VASVGALSGRAADTARKESKAAYKAVETKVEDNAMVAVVAAAGVGFLIGSMIFGGNAAKRAVSNVLPDTKPQRRPAARNRGRKRPRRRNAA